MTKVTITCDRQGDVARAAVWQGKVLCDLYVDRLSVPDMTGALVRGKIVRVQTGHKAAWVECGLDEKVYIESATPLKAGSFVTVRIQATAGEGKAWRGAVQKEDASGAGAGLLAPPPAVWERALAGVEDSGAASVLFAAQDDFKAFQAQKQDPRFTAEFAAQGHVHDGLDERIAALCATHVPLSGGGNLVIERTAALVAIDVNAGEASNFAAVNLVAVREAARQMRLRNLSGIIVIDCLKMKERADISKVMNAFTRASADDRAGVQLFGISKLGLLECTRRHNGPALADVMKGSDA